MPTETQHLEQRVAALQSDLNTKDEQIGALTFSDNDRELSRRSWFDEAKRLEKECKGLRLERRRMDVALVACANERDELRADLASAKADKEAYAQNAIDLRGKLETTRAALRTEVEAGDSWRKEALDLQGKLAERDVLLGDVLDGKHTTPGWNQRMKAALSASAEPSAPCNLAKATAFVERLIHCAGTQQSVATGYLRDILDVLNGGAELDAPVAATHGDDQEFCLCWFEESQQWVVIFPSGKTIANKFGSMGYAEAAALECLGLGQADFDVVEGHSDFYRYERCVAVSDGCRLDRESPPTEDVMCRGDFRLGTACGKCSRCLERIERAFDKATEGASHE